ncbi:hypothetical protein [Campylobacter geochelonis]|nr:hypothetical protein [Campylobacter geochelonis]
MSKTIEARKGLNEESHFAKSILNLISLIIALFFSHILRIARI